MGVRLVILAVFASIIVIKAEAKSTEGIQKMKTEKRYLRNYGMGDAGMVDSTSDEERAAIIDSKTIPSLLKVDPEDIVTTLKRYNLDNLFEQLAKEENNAKAIIAKLSANGKIVQNMEIIDKLNNARTAVQFNQNLTPWLDTKLLDDLASAMEVSGTKPMTRQFTEWYKSGKTPDEFSAAIATISNVDKSKRYAAFDALFRSFVQKEEKNAKKAAEAAAKRWQKLLQLHRAVHSAS
ncbi:hypothetical protein PPTG_06720 [Phytophthora nicotianae INRA-310]|uniref:RxLR effector protein n=1 Tax=Phytophthora nicotianae (strain INRA-310) TaxID=761204 RepID=W2QR83_PHYN3|nr:hypothetical protein PPTG_06720 [Phytophthora nicotianae INRA-310]ETN15451.1 hypothetical protein PPTG_06720 [Phytophthora nicotianae INRA-310]